MTKNYNCYQHPITQVIASFVYELSRRDAEIMGRELLNEPLCIIAR